jgi:hypothetical protein
MLRASSVSFTARQFLSWKVHLRWRSQVTGVLYRKERLNSKIHAITIPPRAFSSVKIIQRMGHG